MSNGLSPWIAVWAVVAAGCGSGAGGDDDVEPGTDAGGGGPDGSSADCPRSAAADDRERFVVVSHPYDGPGDKGERFEVFRLSEAGELSATGHAFTMGNASHGVIAFTPDGEVGITAQSDGTLGVFRLAADGAPEVIAPAFGGSFYAGSVVMAPDGARAYVLDNQWRENGGGVYSVRIGCDGTLTEEGLIVPSKLPAVLLWLEKGRAILAAADVMTSPTDRDAHLLAWGAEPSVMSSVSVFGGGDAIVSAAALGAEQRWALIADNAAYSGVPNRIAVVAVTESGLEPVQVLSPIEDPFAIAVSPFDGSAIVSSGFGDAIFHLSFDASAAEPFAIAGELTYVGGRPQLPSSTVMIDRGALRGRVLIAEVTGIRQVELPAGGGARDLGATSVGEGIPSIVGAIGVQP